MNFRHDDELKAQQSLQQSVAKTLERKRRLGQYAVVWRDGKAIRIGNTGSAAECQSATK